jgi:hypothetical protein
MKTLGMENPGCGSVHLSAFYQNDPFRLGHSGRMNGQQKDANPLRNLL